MGRLREELLERTERFGDTVLDIVEVRSSRKVAACDGSDDRERHFGWRESLRG